MKLTHRLMSALLFFVLLGIVVMPTTSSLAADGNSIKVDREVFSVTLSDGNSYSMVGYLYYKGSFHNRILQVLVHGATYNHNYWDIPSIGGHDYSYARYMADQHYALLALDMLGTGESSKPNGDFLNLAQTANSVHQVLASLRTDNNPVGYAFDKIVLVGHSNGSVISIYTQGTYHDADALITTGWENTVHPLPIDPNALLPALANPYIVIPNPVRDFLFYDSANVDPNVINYDNTQLADTLTRGQFIDLLNVSANTALLPLAQVNGPVMVQLGDHDLIAPASFAAQESAFFSGASSVTVQTLTNIGHAFNAHLTNAQSWTQIDNWITATLGQH